MWNLTYQQDYQRVAHRSAPSGTQNIRYISSKMRPVHTAEGKEQLREPSMHLQQDL